MRNSLQHRSQLRQSQNPVAHSEKKSLIDKRKTSAATVLTSSTLDSNLAKRLNEKVCIASV